MRKLLWFTIGFAAACAIGAYAFTAWLWIGVIFGLCGFVAALLLRNQWKRMPFAAAVLLGVSVGLCWFGCYRQVYLAPAVDADGTQLLLQAEITDYGTVTDYGTKVNGRIYLNERTYRTVLYLKDSPELKPGDWVSGTFRLRLTHEGLEGNTYHRGSGIFLLAYAVESTHCTPAEQIPLRYFTARLRQGIVQRLEALFPEDTAAFAKALFLGDRSDVDYETNTSFKVSGISHIIAVSGLHVSILFSMIFLLSGRKRGLTALIGIPALILFAAVTGFTPSVTRACVMQILFILAEVLLKEYDTPTALSASLLMMLAVNPIAVTSVSLQLSTSCMAGIFLFSDRIGKWISSLSFWKNWKGRSLKVRLRNSISTGVSITLSAMFFTTPLVACYFGTVSLIGVLTNLLTLWVISWIFYGIIAVCLISLFWQQGAMLLAAGVSWMIRYVLTVSRLLSAVPFAAVYTKSPFIIAWLILCYLLILIFTIRRKRKPYWLISCITLSLASAMLISWVLPMMDETRMTVLDVGQGQSIILQANGKTFLVDCGGDDPEKAADQAADTLLSMGIYRLDGVILTHYDGDHADGIPYLLSRIQADTVFLPDVSEVAEAKDRLLNVAGECAAVVYQDLELSWADTSMTIFAPVSSSNDNESGLSVLFQGENCDILITGDLGISGENTLVLKKSLPQLTALVAGHHGSAYSTGSGLLAATKPQYVLISVGADNRYGHPSQTLLERLEQFDCTVYRTDRNGTIVFRR